MRRKRDLTTNDVKSHKACLNLHGGKQIYGMNYYETYAPVVTWFAIRLVIIFGIMFCWALRQVDFVMAYPQAPIEEDIYMEVPQGIDTATGNSKDMVLKLLKNIYGQKQAGRVWNSYLVEKLASIGFRPSLIDNCVFFRDEVIFFALYLASTANYSRTTLAHWNLPGFQSYVLGQSISTYVIIIFANTCVRDLSRSFPLAQKTRSLTHLPRHWHKMTSHIIADSYVASNNSKPPM
jgi:hypothetical protein